jgi:hypothetical protein
MAKYNVTYRCGHAETKQLYGPYAQRERTIAYYKTVDCPACKAEAAKKAAENNGLVVLIGSPKQIAWATDIRAEFIKVVKSLKEQSAGNADDKRVQDIYSFLDSTIKNKEAKWWIDNRSTLSSPNNILKWACTELNIKF